MQGQTPSLLDAVSQIDINYSTEYKNSLVAGQLHTECLLNGCGIS